MVHAGLHRRHHLVPEGGTAPFFSLFGTAPSEPPGFLVHPTYLSHTSASAEWKFGFRAAPRRHADRAAVESKGAKEPEWISESWRSEDAPGLRCVTEEVLRGATKRWL